MKRTQTDYIVIHCSATREDVRYTFEQCRSDHLSKGWADIGYHVYVERTGEAFAGRHLDDSGAHVKGFNSRSVAICYEGGLDELGMPKDTRTGDQKAAINAWVSALLIMYPHAVVVGHRDLFPDINGDGVVDEADWLKHCPCYDVRSEWDR